ncbi:hypothetical protein ACFYKX_04845 [Cytobacillus sp. FJAT-54145]|uniref:N-acetyltransferase domain-containing protein n=1 Tax=Cytobacillus spartinae TaxID=3299023 RepID=A0ABW6KAJ5_9BACI
MSLPIMTRDLAYKLDMLDAYYVEARMSGIEDQDIEIKRLGNSLVLMAKHILIDQFNSIRGFTIEDEPFLNDMLNLYVRNDIKVRLDILPSELNSEIATTLNEHQIIQKGFHTVFYRECTKLEDSIGSKVKVRKILKDELDMFLTTYLKGFGIPESFLDRAKEQRKFWTDVPEFHLYMAMLDDVPVGASVLYIRDEIGYLAGASTLVEYRGIGCQQQQLVKRMNDAADLGCRLLTTQAQFHSTSQRNMQRNGFQIAFTKGIWGMK